MTDDQPLFKTIRTPLWSWINLLSLDAVLIGSFWQAVFTFEFCGRVPAIHEAVIIAVSIWMVYTADRLFDSMRLDLRRPHTMRHRMHHEYRSALIAVWIACSVLDVFLIVRFASEAQLRWGYVALAAVLVYAARVHLAGVARSWHPKELQAGLVFAFGIALPAWAESAFRVDLVLATLMTGTLFAANCFIIASWERDYDLIQGFHSWPTWSPMSVRWIPVALITHLAATMALLLMAWLPPLVAGCLGASDGLLLVLVLNGIGFRRIHRSAEEIVAPVTPLGMFADAALVAPPLIWAASTFVLR